MRPHIALVLCLLMLAGCPHWDRDDPQGAALVFPINRMAPDAVGLEIGVAQLDVTQRQDMATLWRELDPQKLPLEVRKLLDRNGLKAGVMSSRPPAVLADLVYPRPVVLDELNEFQKQLYIKRHLKPESRMVEHAQISNRSGQAHPVNTSHLHPSLSWTVQLGERQSAGSGDYVQGVFAITTFANGDGSVRLVVTPEIHHGESKARIGSAEHGFKFETRQTIERLNDLSFEVVLASGESLVVGPTEDIAELGHLFFGNPDEVAGIDQLAKLAVEGEPAGLPDLDADDGVEGVDGLLDESTAEELDEIDRLLAQDLALGGKAKREKPKPMHRLMLIRVIQTQLDDLFSSTEEIEPLTSVNRY